MLSALLILVQPNCAEDPPGFEEIADVSPDGKFGVRISCIGEPEDPNKINPALITAVEVVSLPSKDVVVKVGQDYEGNPAHLIWSSDSNWFTYSLADGPRVTDTHVYHRSGIEFTQLETESLRVNAKSDVRNEYVNPIRWVKPGVLLLEQFDIFRGGNGEDATYSFTARFDEKTGKFRIISKKKLPSKE